MSQCAEIFWSMSEYVQYVKFMAKYVDMCRKMSKYVNICRNMPKYVKILQNMLKYDEVCSICRKSGARIVESDTTHFQIGFVAASIIWIDAARCGVEGVG